MENKIQYIDIEKLHPHPDNPRKNLGDVSELAESIKVSGILQNLTAVPATGYHYGDYTVIIGHRRLAAAKLAGLKTVPCVITEMDTKEQLATMLLENMQRSDLTLYEQAQGMQMMFDLGETVSSISEKTGLSQSTVRRRMRLTTLDQDAFKKLEGRQIDIRDYDKLFEIKDEKRRNEALKQMGTPNFNWTVNRAKEDEKKEEKIKTYECMLFQKGLKEVDNTSNLKFLSSGQYNLADIPADAQYYNVWAGYVRFYREYTDDEINKKQAQEEHDRRLKAQLDAAKNQIDSLFGQAFEMRKEFVLRFGDFKSYSDVLCEMAVEAIKKANLSYYNIISHDILKYLISICEDEDINIREYIKKQKNKQQMLLYLSYSVLDDKSYTCRDYNAKYIGNEQLKQVYSYLVRLGYEMSEEEKALLDGTHELYAKDTEQ